MANMCALLKDAVGATMDRNEPLIALSGSMNAYKMKGTKVQTLGASAVAGACMAG